MKYVLLTSVAAAFVTHPAQAETITLTPSSKWALSYDEEGCRLARFFGEGEARTALVLTRNEPDSKDYSMVIAGSPVEKIEGNRGDEIAVAFGPAGEPMQTRPLEGALGEIRPALVFGSVSMNSEDQIVTSGRSNKVVAVVRQAGERQVEDDVTSMTVTGRFHELHFDFGSMKEVHVAMRDCTGGLLEAWGLDAARHATMTRKPMPLNAEDWIKPADYPKSMIRQSQSAIISARLLVDADGKPTECFIQRTTRPKEFDSAVCSSVLKRARFDPALDANGVPMASYYQVNVRFWAR